MKTLRDGLIEVVSALVIEPVEIDWADVVAEWEAHETLLEEKRYRALFGEE